MTKPRPYRRRASFARRSNVPAKSGISPDVSEGWEPPQSCKSADMTLGDRPLVLVVVVVRKPSTPGQGACKT